MQVAGCLPRGWAAAAARAVPVPSARTAVEGTAATCASQWEGARPLVGQDLRPRATQLPERGQG